MEEYNEILAAQQEEMDTRSGASWGELLKPGMRIRTFIAFFTFFLQQWAGQNSISYYAPQIFKSIGLTGTSVGLLASGIYGIVKIISTAIFVAVGIEKVGRSKALGFAGLGMSTFLWIVGALFVSVPFPPVVLGILRLLTTRLLEHAPTRCWRKLGLRRFE
jgi:type IV secretory pathway TrbL component